jgi:diaminohydroxyphosphoribosylaminopyrimidine deaminase/5-amino-6-(5-phosphoribosylamino)uracil reductase
VWLSSKQLGRPFVTLKWASSLDGRIAATDGSSKWISGEESRRDAHLLRRDVDAILVGTGTVIADDPELTARDQNGNYFEHQPLRVVMGERALPSDKRVFNDKAETIQIRARNPQVVMQELQNRQVKHLLVEGGSKIASEFIRNNLVDEFIVYLAPLLLGGPRLAINDLGIPSMAEAINLRITEQKLLGEDLFIRARR